MFRESFLLQAQDFPTIRFILATPKQLALLADHGHIVLLDTTFGISAHKLLLTTIMVFVQGWPVPAGWLLSDKQTAQEYR